MTEPNKVVPLAAVAERADIPPADNERGGGGPDLPVVQVKEGEMSDAIDAMERALLEAGPTPVYQRGGSLVQICDRPARRSDGTVNMQEAVAPITAAGLREAFGRVVSIQKWDARASDWRRRDPPSPLVEAYLARPRWSLPDLRHLISTPTIREDGSLLAAAGYDERTGLFLTAELPDLDVPDRPTKADAERANDELTALLSPFPFAETGAADDDTGPAGLSLAVIMAGLVSAILRPTLPSAPGIAITSPAPGTGKSYLIDLVATIATGRTAVCLSTGTKPEEFEKALGAALLDARPFLSIDNLAQPLGGQLLCMAISQERVEVRVLGLSKVCEVSTGTALFATGNNLRVAGDAARRVLMCQLDARMEHPESRTFERDLLAEAIERRGELVSAALTIARWGALTRDPAPRGRAFAGFDAWYRRVRDPLVALGHVDPVMALDVTRAADLDAAKFGALIGAWRATFTDDEVTSSEVIALGDREATPPEVIKIGNREVFASEVIALGDALAGLFGSRASNPRSLGNYLAAHTGRIVDGHRFRRVGHSRHAVKWMLEKCSDG